MTIVEFALHTRQALPGVTLLTVVITFPLLVQTITIVRLYNVLVKLVILGVHLNQDVSLYHHVVPLMTTVVTV